MTTQQLTRIAPQSRCSFTIKRGQVLRVVDPLGEQVSDLVRLRRARSRLPAVVRSFAGLCEPDLPDDERHPLRQQ